MNTAIVVYLVAAFAGFFVLAAAFPVGVLIATAHKRSVFAQGALMSMAVAVCIGAASYGTHLQYDNAVASYNYCKSIPSKADLPNVSGLEYDFASYKCEEFLKSDIAAAFK